MIASKNQQLVLFIQPSASVKGESWGSASGDQLGYLHCDQDGKSYFICSEPKLFAGSEPESAKYRSRLAEHIHSSLDSGLELILVVHKKPENFLYGVVGIADELLKRGRRFRLGFVYPHVDKREAIRSALLEAVETFADDELPPIFEVPVQLFDGSIFNEHLSWGD